MAFDPDSYLAKKQPMGAVGTTATDIAEGVTTEQAAWASPTDPKAKAIIGADTKFDPDAYLAKAKPTAPSGRPAHGQKLSDLIPGAEKALPPTSTIPRPRIDLTGKMPAHDPQAQAKLSASQGLPPTAAGEAVLGGLGKAWEASKLEGLAPELGAASAMRAPSLGERLATPFVKGTDLARDVLGTKLPGAREAATAATRGAVETGVRQQGQRVKAIEDVQSAIDANLAKTKITPPNLDAQGGLIRESFNNAIQVGKDARKTTADQLFSKVRDAAEAKEATGARVDTKDIVESLRAVQKEAEGISDLETGLGKMINSIAGRPEAPPTSTIGPFAYPGAKAPEKTFSQLETTRRYLNDIAYSGETEGYSAILRGHAKDAAHAIDEAMQKFLPEFGEYKATYRKMSEPLESINTRLGRALAGTEGGLTEGAYSKVANADLPNRLFAKREGIDLLVDAFAGGKNAPPEARAKAAQQVDTMVENWLMETIGQGPAAKGAAKLEAPGVRAALSGAPKVQERVGARLAERAGKERTVEQLGKLKETTLAAKNKLAEDLATADALATEGSAASKQKAYDTYVSTLSKGKTAGLITAQQYKVARDLIDRATTLEERTHKARMLAAKVATGTVGAIGAYETIKHY